MTDTPPNDIVQLELFTNRFRAIAEEMGEMLRRTAISTNIKERLDFSCAILDAGGELVVNAPHMPVHLGALGLCVRSLLKVLDLRPGDMVVTNHPAFGGSHLPDITLVAPIYSSRGILLGFVANRAHHAEIGGTSPGSMPPFAVTLGEEGVVIPPFHLIRDNRPNWPAMAAILTSGRYPTRALQDNLADLRAAVAANFRGVAAMQGLAKTHDEETVLGYMSGLKVMAARQVRAALARLPDGAYKAVEYLDDGSALQVCITVSGDTAHFDFAGSAPVHAGNLNATPAIVRSVVIYVLRLMIDAPLPLNEGLMQPVTVAIPESTLLCPDFGDDPDAAPAVVGGNVETSQRLVDTLLHALQLSAGSQGTMNNTLFGNEHFGYYETVCGGTGAGPGFAGASAVHSHMTNTRITDPEILEVRYPVRLERFAIRPNSAGLGQFQGGNGVVREITFLADMTLSIISQHRTEGPFGLNGGSPGRPGKQWVVRADGSVQPLAAVDGCAVRKGDRLVLHTPGGGGFGKPQQDSDDPGSAMD
jgi:5-oxoprolinase (ATP-hydrolysing)